MQLPLSQPLSSRVIARTGSAAATLGDDLPGGDMQQVGPSSQPTFPWIAATLASADLEE